LVAAGVKGFKCFLMESGVDVRHMSLLSRFAELKRLSARNFHVLLKMTFTLR